MSAGNIVNEVGTSMNPGGSSRCAYGANDVPMAPGDPVGGDPVQHVDATEDGIDVPCAVRPAVELVNDPGGQSGG